MKVLLGLFSISIPLWFFVDSLTAQDTHIELHQSPASQEVSFDTSYQEVPIENVWASSKSAYGESSFKIIESVKVVTQIRANVGDNSFYLLGSMNNRANPNVKDYTLMNLNADYQENWAKTYNDEYLEEFGISMICREDAIYIASTSAISNRSDNNVNVVKTDKSGKLLWSKIWKVPGSQPVSNFMYSGSTLYCVGRTVNNMNDLDLFLTKIDDTGKTASSAVLDDDFVSMGYAIESLANNEYAVVKISRNPATSKKWVFLVGFDEQLNHKWTKKVVETSGDNPEAAMIKDKSGNLYIQSQLGVKDFGYQILLTKISPEGMVVWNKTYGLANNAGSNNRLDKRTFMTHSLDGDILMGGNTGTLYGTGINYVFEVDQEGAVEWATQFANPYGYLVSVSPLPDKSGYLLGGYFSPNLKSSNSAQGAIVAINSVGEVID